jgi:hypothetical protein
MPFLDVILGVVQEPPPQVMEIATNRPVTSVPSSIVPNAAKAAER